MFYALHYNNDKWVPVNYYKPIVTYNKLFHIYRICYQQTNNACILQYVFAQISN
jgi:hypothetical protein